MWIRGQFTMRTISSLAGVLCVLAAAAGLARADDKADAQALLDRAIKAAGGEANLKKFQGSVSKGKGTLHEGGFKVTGEWYFQAPDRVRSVYEFDDGQGQKIKVLSVVNADKGWSRTGDGETDALEGDALKEEQEEAYENWLTTLTPLKDKAFQLTALSEVKVGDRPALGLKVTRAGHGDVELYFDKENALLVKLARKAKDIMADKDVKQEAFFSNYKNVQGIMQPMKIEIKRDGQAYFDVEMSEIKFSEKLDDGLFTKPGKDQ
jgi:hypothetical protein